jgi:DNA repair protein SbcC/Rad50
MKILAIRGKNLASIEGDFEIDFTREPLLSAGIFAITGPTGSGKSTILDALCLALFAQSPRQVAAMERGVELADGESGKISQNDPRSILRKGTAEGYAEVDFVGLDGNHYRSKWSVRRARNKASGNLQDHNIQLSNITTGAMFPEKKTETLREIERLIGLNYDQFTRSVLLAQGDFTAFLKAGRDEKSALLEKLTGTAIYTQISKSIYEKTKTAEAYYQEINSRLSGITLLDDSSKQQLIRQKTEIEKQLIEANQHKEQCRKELEWHQQYEKLTENLKNAELNLEETEKTKTESAERNAHLNLVELVQPARSLITAHHEKLAAVTKKNEDKNNISEKYSSLESQLVLLKAQEEEAQKASEIAEKAFSDALPLLKKASELDTLIASNKKNLAEASIEFDLANVNIKKQEGLLSDSKNLHDSLKTELESVTQWLENNRMRQPVVENLSVIQESLQGAAKQVLEEKNLKAEKSKIRDNYNIASKENIRIDALHKQQREIIEETLKNNQELLEKISALSPETLEKREREISETLQQLTEARACWESLYESQNNIARLITEKLQATANLKIYQNDIEKCKVDLQEAGIRRDQTKKMLDQAKMRTAENVETLRSQLAENEPCPVCGSLEHPFASGDISFHTAMEEFQNEYLKWSETYDEKVRLHASLEGYIIKYNEDIRRLSLEIDSFEKRTATLTHQWNGYILPEIILFANGPIRSGVLKKEIENIREEVKSVRQKLSEYKNLKTELDQNRSNFDKLKDDQNGLEKQLSEFSKQKSLLELAISQIDNRISELQNNYQETVSRLNVWFVQPDWVEKWSSNPEMFVKKLLSFSDDWHLKHSRLDELGKKLEVVKAQSVMMKNQMEGLQVNLEQANLKLKKLQDENTHLLSQRNAIFDGKPVSEVENVLNKAVEQSRKEIKEALQKTKMVQSDKDGLNGTLQQLETDLNILLNETEIAGKKVNDWLQEFNNNSSNLLDKAGLLSLLSFNLTWIDNERKAIRQISDAVLTARTTLSERKAQLEIHQANRISENDKEKIAQDFEGFEDVIKNLASNQSEVEFRLREDENNRKTTGDLLLELEKRRQVWERWQKLNELLGSADGKKFRQIAQEYTLEVLLGFANIHLKELSGRYKLEVVPDSLALQVVDLDMGNEVRSVHSLSGGESFLVSLALALALASLSSHRMNVESLFIDEGFGSLDPATLNIAMDALEQLHNQGRKVGVISHVQEMTERILTKVEVKKLSGGKSKVLIIKI